MSGAWVDAGSDVRSVTLTVTTSCDHCALTVPINGPVEEALCPHCAMTTRVAHLFQILSFAAAEARVAAEYKYEWFGDPSPECLRCGKVVSIATLRDKAGATTTFACEGCSAANPTYPAPSWLKDHFPNALQIFGGDAVGPSGPAGVAVATGTAAAAPRVVTCPTCGAGLSDPSDGSGTWICHYCSARVIVPGVPVVAKGLVPRRWTMTYTDKLRCDLLREWEKTNRRREFVAERAREREAEARARGEAPGPQLPAAAPETGKEESSPMHSLGAWVGKHLRGSKKG
jgi:DNA-directed RNA polymerase subunit RPC12/RpoP